MIVSPDELNHLTTLVYAASTGTSTWAEGFVNGAVGTPIPSEWMFNVRSIRGGL